MTIGKKLTAGLGIMLLLVLIMGSVFLWATSRVEQEMKSYLEARNLNGVLTARIGDHYRWMDGLASGVFIQGKPFKGKLDPDECDLGKWMASYKPSSAELAGPFKALNEPHRKLHATAERILAAYKTGNINSAHQIFIDETVPAVTTVQQNLGEMKDILRANEESEYKHLQTVQRQSNIVTFGLTLSIIAFGIIGGVFFVRGINKPVQKVTAIMKKVATGDLTEKVEGVKSRDEIGQMATYTNEMIENLSSMIAQIKTNADQLVAASSQIAASAEQTSKNSESSATAVEEMTSTMHEMSTNIQNVTKNTMKQASSVTETSSSIEQMVASIQRVAENVKRLVSISEKSKDAVSSGSVAVAKASTGMNEINSAIAQSARTIMSLGSRTEEMAKIVDVIDDIAEQTNLLALNAAIEAARAGEQGMGFAVVAEEVRKLAERSAKSTREIADLIHSVGKESAGAVDNMTRSTGIVEQGLVSSREVIQALEGIKASVDEVSKYSSEIGAATQEQASGSEQIGKAMVDLNEVTQEISTSSEEQSTGAEQFVRAIEKVREMVQQNAASSVELASSAEQLSKQSGGLQTLVEQFALNGNGRH
ncbi:MAG: methyl-accepting chemotaxis protein [Thermodesulfovibrionales bacterium]